MFDSRPVSIPLGNLAAAASAGVALALEARASVAALSKPQFPDPGTTTGMYPPQPEPWEPSSAFSPTTEPGTTTGMYPEPNPWNTGYTNAALAPAEPFPGTTTGMIAPRPPYEPTYASATSIEPPITIGRMQPDPTDPSGQPVYAGYSDPTIRPTLTGAIAPFPEPWEPTYEPSAAAAPTVEPEPWNPWGDPTILGMWPVEPFPSEPSVSVSAAAPSVEPEPFPWEPVLLGMRPVEPFPWEPSEPALA
jgi:hypothetical protein